MAECSTCRFWYQFWHTHYGDITNPGAVDAVKAANIGQCYFNPPTVVYQQAAANVRQTWAGEVVSVVNPKIITAWPETKANQWCSKYEQKGGA